MKSSRLESAASYLVLVVGALSTLLPFVSIVLASLQPSNALVSGLHVPHSLNFDNFRQAWTAATFGALLKSSVVISVTVVLLSVAMATLAGYALATMRIPAGGLLFGMFLVGLTLPVELIVIPLYFDLRSFHLTDNYLGVILVECALFMPFGVFWMRNHFQSMPRELIEAAEMDSASPRAILFRVLLPLAGPSLSSLAVLIFLWSWNQLLLVLILMQDPSKRTAPAGLGFFVNQNTSNIPVLCAATLIVMLPVLVVYLVFQRKFISGMLQGGIRG
ncbi:carbohydrate ABC transporter permease [Rugosimonospora africana]|uniref:Sugar ABC transporter permease n=1 Tax=Rugosimonospora africana TaxID=556532 RepID=A0A8J3QZA7_9ACTN|nr:carbohydrate ABC transporter permease [Rugosimonospora africana]GIH19653.1 sugar ABC transporter permease [Rugosimonospora africana]